MRYLFIATMTVVTAVGCATKKPPTSGEIRSQSLPTLPLSNQVWQAGSAAAGLIQDNWLAEFNDPVLMSLVDEALTNSLDLRLAAARVEKADAYVGVAKAALRPSIGLFGTGGFNMGGGDLSSALMGGMLGASWELDLWGRARYGRNAAQAQFASAEADLEFARQSLAATVAQSWFTATETFQQKKLAAEMATLAENMAQIAEKRHAVGVGNEQDVVLARASTGEFKDMLQQATLAHENAVRALEVLLVRYPSAELKTRTDLPALPGPIPVGMPLEMLERRPDLIAAERRVDAAFNRVGEAKKSMLPRLSLNISGSYISSDVLELAEDYDTPSAGAGGQLSAPIYTGGALKSQVKVRTAEQKEAVAEFGRLALRAITDVENALAASRILSERVTILTQTVKDHEKALELVETSYRVGNQDMRNVIQQQMAVHNARMALLSVQSEQLSQRVNLHLALGGGFKERPVKLESDSDPE